jgi:CDP-glucose 4,6-dehydratase
MVPAKDREASEPRPRPSFWRGRRVLVTGHTGFKGGWLCLWLQRLGADVLGLALAPPTSPSIFETARVAEGMSSREDDVRDLPAVEAALAEHQPEVVVHLAAQSLVRPSYRDPLETLTTNVIGVATLLEAVRRHPCPRAVVMITSDKCYENREWHWGYREDDALGGRDPYSISKACAELVVRSLRESFFRSDDGAGVPVATARAGNVIGGGDWSDERLVPDIVRALLAGHAPELRSPRATRPWQHVLEPLSGYLSLVEHLWEHGQPYAQPWNFGPSDDDAMPVSWICERLCDLWGGGAGWTLQAGEHPFESTALKLDASKAHEELGWRPRLEVEEALRWVVEWFHGYRDGADLRRLTEEQIARYEGLAVRGRS